MTFDTPWFSSVPLKSSSCQSRGLWRTLEWSSCMNLNHSQLPASTWLVSRIWWAQSPLCHCFWPVTQPPPSLKMWYLGVCTPSLPCFRSILKKLTTVVQITFPRTYCYILLHFVRKKKHVSSGWDQSIAGYTIC